MVPEHSNKLEWLQCLPPKTALKEVTSILKIPTLELPYYRITLPFFSRGEDSVSPVGSIDSSKLESLLSTVP